MPGAASSPRTLLYRPCIIYLIITTTNNFLKARGSAKYIPDEAAPEPRPGCPGARRVHTGGVRRTGARPRPTSRCVWRLPVPVLLWRRGRACLGPVWPLGRPWWARGGGGGRHARNSLPARHLNTGIGRGEGATQAAWLGSRRVPPTAPGWPPCIAGRFRSWPARGGGGRHCGRVRRAVDTPG